MESTLLPGILAEHVERHRSVECGRCQAINFATWHPLKAGEIFLAASGNTYYILIYCVEIPDRYIPILDKFRLFALKGIVLYFREKRC